MSMAARDALRATLVAQIPRWYNPWFHLIFPSVVGLGVLCTCLLLLRDLRLVELLIVPFMLVFSNAAEWRLHRDVLHKRRPFAKILYDRHTPIHHRIFLTEDMAIRSPREFHMVLIPAYGILAILAVTVPLALGIAALLTPNTGALFLCTCMAYSLSYEWLHLCYHLPEESWIGRRRLVRLLRHHHAVHHAPELMQRWNFNVTVPLWDLVRGTYYRPAR